MGLNFYILLELFKRSTREASIVQLFQHEGSIDETWNISTRKKNLS